MKISTTVGRLRDWQMRLSVGAILTITCVAQAQLSYNEGGVFGNLDQNNAIVTAAYGGNGCDPTAVANGLIWLNNTYGPFNGAGGPLIMPGNGTYDTVTALGNLMGTTAASGTTFPNDINGLSQYIGTAPPGQQVSPPVVIAGGQRSGGLGGFAQIQNSAPTALYLYNQLFANNAVMFGVYWGSQAQVNATASPYGNTGNGGHELTLTGISINAAGNGGTLNFIDPSGGAAVNNIGWQMVNGFIFANGFANNDPDNAGAYPSFAIGDDEIVSAPEPTTFALLVVGVVGLGARRVFRRAKK